MVNTNPETGVRYTVYALNKSIDSDVAQDLWYNYGTDLSYEAASAELRKELEREADDLEEEVRIGIAETDPSQVGDEDWEESRIEDAWGAKGYASREDFIETEIDRRSQNIQIDEPVIEGQKDGVKYRIDWLGGAPLLWILESPHLGKFRLCSPCVPNACDGDHPDEDGHEGYAVPAEWLMES